jgi:hypothetical protein
MKRAIIMAMLVLTVAGCVRLPVPEIVAEVRLVSAKGLISAPLFNGRAMFYNANVQPGETIVIDFRPNRDQYGNATGFNDSRYQLGEISVRCDLKTADDTIFNYRKEPNMRVWFPGYTAPLEPISGLPVPYVPLEGYPWDACREQGIPEMGGQQATMYVTAKATWIEIEFVLPEQDGTYRLDLPGKTATADNTIRVKVGVSGEYRVIHSGGEVYEFDVPEDWFWIDATFKVEVGPEGLC